ncbi:hypothetical protein ASC77_24085 [Nocardioides sp. Root1257]|nr:hypothetical protein ASC77_24085 [Nocardioides sp. Root1257]
MSRCAWAEQSRRSPSACSGSATAAAVSTSDSTFAHEQVARTGASCRSTWAAAVGLRRWVRSVTRRTFHTGISPDMVLAQIFGRRYLASRAAPRKLRPW